MKTVFVIRVIRPFAALALAATALCVAGLHAQSPPEEVWSLEHGRGIAAEQVTGPSLKLEGKQLSGSTGCNSFTAIISEVGERVKIDNLSMTRKLCAPRRDATERAFVSALGQTEYLDRKPERLTFLSGKREPLLVWKIAEPKGGGEPKGTETQKSENSEKSATPSTPGEPSARSLTINPRAHVAHRHGVTTKRRARHAHRHQHMAALRHGGHRHAHAYKHRHRHRHVVRLFRGCFEGW